MEGSRGEGSPKLLELGLRIVCLLRAQGSALGREGGGGAGPAVLPGVGMKARRLEGWKLGVCGAAGTRKSVCACLGAVFGERPESASP